MDAPAPAPRRGDRVWMAILWLFLVAWILGVAFWKSPAYARLYDALDMPVPAATRAVLSAAGIVASFWFLSVPALLAPLAPIALGTFDRRSGNFIAVVIVATFFVVSLSVIFLFVPYAAIEQRLQQSPAPSK